jgi:hypothetical protein
MNVQEAIRHHEQADLNPFKAAAPFFGMEAIAAPVHEASDLGDVFAAQARQPNSAFAAALSRLGVCFA